jgi:hypothetical protein
MSSTYIASSITTSDRFFPRIMADDFVKNATMTASSGTAEPAQNLTTYSRWTPDAADPLPTLYADFGTDKTIDYIAAYATYTDVAILFTAYAYYSGAWHAITATALSRTDTGCLYWLFPSLVCSKIAIECNCTGANKPSVAVMKSGLSLQIPVGLPIGYEPSLFNPNEKMTNTVSVTGQILGTQVESQRINESLTFDLLDPDFVNDNWMPIRAMMRDVGLFFAWNLAGFPEHVIYGVAVGDPSAVYSQCNAMKVMLKIEGTKHVL